MQLDKVIIQNAGELFQERGYAGTSMRQIAKASNCTNAALYHYFPDGKKHILREVIRQLGVGVSNMLEFPEANTLEELLTQLYDRLNHRLPQMVDRFNWLTTHFEQLSDEEKNLIQDPLLNNQKALREQIERFVPDSDKAQRLVWLLQSSIFGYHQLFVKLEIGKRTPLSIPEFGSFLTNLIIRAEAQHV